MRKFLPICVVMALLLPGCASLEKHESSVKLVTQYSTLKYLEQVPDADKAERKARIIAVATDVKNAAQGEVTLLTLHEFVNEQLDGANLSPADRLLADSLVQIIADELQIRIGEGVLSPEQRVQVAEVMDWVIQAASMA